MVQALMKEQVDKPLPNCEEGKGNEVKEGERENSSTQEGSQKRCSSTPLTHSPKR